MPTTKEMVEEQLRLIASSCPHDILDNARKMNSDYEDSKDPIVSNLFGLDRAIQVPNNTPHTLKFSTLVFEFVEWLLCLIEEKNYNLKFDAIPVGSYPSNVKIGDMDEFDFLLKWHMTSEVVAAHNLFLKERFDTYKAEKPANKFGLYKLIKDIVYNLEKVEDCTIEGPTLSGPAVNLGLNWKCHSGHHHSLGIDLTIAFTTSTTLENFLCNHKSDFKYSPFNDPILDRKQNLLSINDGDTCFTAATNAFDEQMFLICDKISRNIKVSFRLLKFTRDSLFPHVLQQKMTFTDYQLHDKHEQSISSHYLKQILFHEVQKFPNGNSWEENNLVERMVSMLTVLTGECDHRDFYGLCSLNVADFWTNRTFSITEEAYWFTKKVADKLVSLLKETTSNESAEFVSGIPLQSRPTDSEKRFSISPKLEGIDPDMHQQIQNCDCPSQQQQKSIQQPRTKIKEHVVTNGLQIQEQTVTTDLLTLDQLSETVPLIQKQTSTTDLLFQEQIPSTDSQIQKQTLTDNSLTQEQRLIADPLIQKQTLTTDPLNQEQTIYPLIQQQMSKFGIRERPLTTYPLIKEQTLSICPPIQDTRSTANRTFIPIRNMLFNVEIGRAHFLLRFFGGSKLTYIKPALPFQKLSRFYLVDRMKVCIDDICGDEHIIDLVSATDAHIRAILMFFKLDVLSEDDLKTTIYVRKLQAFDRLIEDSGPTCEEILGQYAGDNHQYQLTSNKHKPYWYDQLSSDLELVLSATSRADIGMLLRFATRKITITELQHTKTEPLQLISKIHLSLVLKLDNDVNDGAVRVDEIDIDDISDIGETVEESIRWYCSKHIMEMIKAL